MMRLALRQYKRMRAHRQGGAITIEFALLFFIFFAVFYALVSYAIVMMLQQAFVHAAEEGARAAIAIDPLAYTSSATYYSSGVAPYVRTTIGTALDWLPTKAKTKVLGVNNANVQLTFVNSLLTVRVLYPSYASDPLLPMLTLPVFGQIPQVPTDLAGTAMINL
jgi:Flp pilus assembly protein TadG